VSQLAFAAPFSHQSPTSASPSPSRTSFTLGFTSPYKLTDSNPSKGYDLSDSQASLFGSLVNVGAIMGALIGGVSLDLIGRRL
jgi:SP family facilitated glucose transporter-like MFS transporter 8